MAELRSQPEWREMTEYLSSISRNLSRVLIGVRYRQGAWTYMSDDSVVESFVKHKAVALPPSHRGDQCAFIYTQAKGELGAGSCLENKPARFLCEVH